MATFLTTLPPRWRGVHKQNMRPIGDEAANSTSSLRTSSLIREHEEKANCYGCRPDHQAQALLRADWPENQT